MNECILVVDDDPEIVNAIAITLEREGYQVRKACDGLQALDQCLDPAVKLILIDVMMPRLDGLSALLRIRERRNLPVIVLSAKSEDTDKILGLSMGARRGDFFWAIQGIILFYTLACWALQLFMSAFPALAGWEVRDRWMLLYMFDGTPWAYPLLCVALMILGCLSGMLMMNHKVLGLLVTMLSVLALLVATIVLILMAETDWMEFLFYSEWGWLWTTLPRIMIAVLSAGAVGGEFLIWKVVQRYVVR